MGHDFEVSLPKMRLMPVRELGASNCAAVLVMLVAVKPVTPLIPTAVSRVFAVGVRPALSTTRSPNDCEPVLKNTVPGAPPFGPPREARRARGNAMLPA